MSMGAKADFVRKKYGPLARKGLEAALLNCLARDFPQLGGMRMLRLAAARILEVVFQHLQPRAAMRHGQVLWTGIALADKPGWRKPLEQMKWVPLVLDLVVAEDVEAIVARQPAPQRLLRRCLRLCRQAHEQGALLSNCDLAVLLGIRDSTIAKTLAAHEKETASLVPRRATLHDVGSGVTHKRLICWKRHGEGKTSDQIARESYHSLEAVDRYLGQYNRVAECRRQGFDVERTAYLLSCGVGLVKEYWTLVEQLEGGEDG
jgi:hypothetical protein